MNIHEVLRRPLITEKNTMLGALNKYSFEVSMNATKPMIEAAVVKLFKVSVTNVNVLHVRGKVRRVGKQRNPGKSRDWKKAVVTLKAGDRIEFFEGV